MSIKSAIVMSAAALTLVAGVGAAGTVTANAATPACGNTCINWYSTAFGITHPPTWVLDVPNQAGRAGSLVTVARASGANQGEDFQLSNQGVVSDFVAAGLMAPGLDTLYGSLPVLEIEYTPGGSPSGQCLGVATAPGLGTPVTLQPCSVSAKTLWIFDQHAPIPADLQGALISGATSSSFQYPYALTTLLQGLPLFTTPLDFSLPAGVLNHQIWGMWFGPLPVPSSSS